jgi:hypothetical protein
VCRRGWLVVLLEDDFQLCAPAEEPMLVLTPTVVCL